MTGIFNVILLCVRARTIVTHCILAGQQHAEIQVETKAGEMWKKKEEYLIRKKEKDIECEIEK